MTAVPTDLSSLLAPVTVEHFLRHHYERAPLCVLGEGRRAPPVTLDAVLEALPREVSGKDVELFPAHFDRGRHDTRTLLSHRPLLEAYLAEGHPLVWNRARHTFPALDALCDALARFFRARVWPNVYVTGTAGTPFELHFDAHEVFALHCEGLKQWELSALRADRPTDDDPQPEVMATRREEARAHIAARFTVTPGDVVYIPRGLFHNARAMGGTSLHVTFGIRGVTGHDVARLLAACALGDRALRRYAPPTCGDFDTWLREVIVRLGEHLLDPRFETNVQSFLHSLIGPGNRDPPSR